MKQRRTVGASIADLMIAVLLIAAYIVPLAPPRLNYLDPQLYPAIATGCFSLGGLVWYHRLSRWTWVVIAGYLIHPGLLGLWAMENYGFRTRFGSSLVWLEPYLFRAFRYEGMVSQILFSVGFVLTLGSVARQMHRNQYSANAQPARQLDEPNRPQSRGHL